jgi:hypothetical protein
VEFANLSTGIRVESAVYSVLRTSTRMISFSSWSPVTKRWQSLPALMTR